VILRYPLTFDQYTRFQHPSNTREIQILGKPLGVMVQDGWDHDSWTFSGAMEGQAWINGTKDGITIRITQRPWWALRWLLDAAFKAALK
jgi:hypothetical protein